MSKRLCPFTDEPYQAIKKQETLNNSKGRHILSTPSERALQLLYLGATKQFKPKPEQGPVDQAKCSQCMEIGNNIKCSYCDKTLCCNCAELCRECHQEYCKNCSYNIDAESCICYTCY
ncbi:unnamed protein product [Ceutorhynchus assimilis]|uniref:Apoptosis regulatory protein Siva n=1 Tax=Ceutorhynchus assimilis TaxID=467358 RepID=A0A9N9MKD9_9CUCU|nr:unnamed protein product [Ceutorhynchus assimilis]